MPTIDNLFMTSGGATTAAQRAINAGLAATFHLRSASVRLPDRTLERGVVVCLEGKGGRSNGFLKAMEV
jgi:hypothetical protein